MISARQERPAIPEPTNRPEIAQLNDAVSELNDRLGKLEEERDFYRALLESPKRNEISPPSGEGPPQKPA